MKTSKLLLLPTLVVLLCLFSWVRAFGQIPPSGDAFTNTAAASTNYGANVLLNVNGAKEIAYIQFNLASIPASASVTQATLKLYVNAVTTGGSFNVDFVNGSWAESTITSSLAPVLGTTIQASVPLTTASKNQYILIDVTSAVQAWLSGSQANDGIALVANGTFNASFDSKENTTTSHPPELDVVFGGSGGIGGITTASGSGLMGGGTSGTLNLSLTNTCATNQVLAWTGTAWACSTPKGSGTITGVTAGTDLTGGGTSGKVTLNLDTTQVPQLAAANVFTNNQTITGTLSQFGLTVSEPSYLGILLESPVTSVGAGLEFETTGNNGGKINGMSWQILNTGTSAKQGANKLNFRNDSAGLDVMTMLANGQVGIGTNAPDITGWLEVIAPQNGSSEGLNSNGVNGIFAEGASNPGNGEYDGGSGILGQGGKGTNFDGDGGVFTGGSGSSFGDGIEAAPGSDGANYAGNFTGDINVTGRIFAGTKDFKIDHPLDPANKYLVHASVESSEMMDIYTGNVITDGQGEARVQLPDWFEALNTDFRYQLTVIGQFAQAIVSSEVKNHEFGIRSSVPNVKVSWQITGVRQDAFAKANPMVVEEEKDARLKGFYIHPELYGAPVEKQIEWARHPQMMKQLQKQRNQVKEKRTSITASANR
ncbi:MAG: DNRLRE domain-containing protein [Terriglobales bacterium]